MGKISRFLIKYQSNGVLLFNEKYVNQSHVLYFKRQTFVIQERCKSFPWVTHGKSDVNQWVWWCKSFLWVNYGIFCIFHHDPVVKWILKILWKYVKSTHIPVIGSKNTIIRWGFMCKLWPHIKSPLVNTLGWHYRNLTLPYTETFDLT